MRPTCRTDQQWGISIPRSMPQIPTAQEVGEVEWCPEQDDEPDVRHVYSHAEAQVPMEHVPQLAGMPQCRCRWFRAWQLPCRHIWLHHFASNLPTLINSFFCERTTASRHTKKSVDHLPRLSTKLSEFRAGLSCSSTTFLNKFKTV